MIRETDGADIGVYLELYMPCKYVHEYNVLYLVNTCTTNNLIALIFLNIATFSIYMATVALDMDIVSLDM
jgi:hypothetical protein